MRATPFEDMDREAIRVQWNSLTESIVSLKKKIADARTQRFRTGKFIDRNVYLEMEGRVKRLKAQRQTLQDKMGEVKKSTNESTVKLTALCGVLKKRFGKAVMLALLSEAEAVIEREAKART